MKILVVDDELVSRQKMKKIMDGFGQCETVESGTAAIAAFQKALEEGVPFGFVTLDINMPEMDGTETLFNIREIERKKKILKEKQVIIIMVTSLSDKDSVIACIQAGCNDYVVKPFNKEIIREKFDKHIIKWLPETDSINIDDVISTVQEVHCSFGQAYLLQQGFAEKFVKIAELHDGMKYFKTSKKEILVVNLANYLTRKIGYSLFNDEEIELSELESAKLLGIDSDFLDAAGEEVTAMMQATSDIF